MAPATFERVSRAALRVQKRSLDQAFTILQLVFVATLLALTFQYDADTQLFPLVVGTTTLCLLLALLALQLSNQGGIADEPAPIEELAVDADQRRERRINLFMIFFWMVGLIVLVLLVGFLPGTLVFLLAYYRFRAKNSVLYTMLYSGAVWGFVVVVFDVILRTRFYTGVFDVVIPFLP